MQTQMMLESLSLHRVAWGDDMGKMKGTVEFSSGLGKMTVIIDPSKAARIIEIVAEEMVAQAQATANLMAAQVIAQAAPKQLTSEVQDA